MYTFLYFLNTQNGTFKNDKNREFHIRNIYIYFTIFKKTTTSIHTYILYTYIQVLIHMYFYSFP